MRLGEGDIIIDEAAELQRAFFGDIAGEFEIISLIRGLKITVFGRDMDIYGNNAENDEDPQNGAMQSVHFILR